MTPWLRHPPAPRGTPRLAVLLWMFITSPVLAQLPDAAPSARGTARPSLEERVRRLEQRQSDLRDQQGESGSPFAIAREEDPTGLLPETMVPPGMPGREDVCRVPELLQATPDYFAGYDDGFRIAPTDSDRFPFSLKVNNQTQLRYTGFARDVRTFTDSAGVVSPVTDRSNFEIPRGRLLFSGFAFLPDLTYNLKIDYNTVTANPVNFLSYWLAYRFNRALTLHVGQNNVPGSREWLVSSMGTLGPDRSLATTFFRPSLSQGIWATGEPLDGLFYHAMIANGFNTLGTTPQELDSRMTFSLSLWAEPWGDFGPAYSDFEWHDEPAIRYGTSLTYSPESGQHGNPDLPENADLRLTNGTLLTETGALAPGVTLNVYSVGLAAFDLAFKYHGWSVSGELYLRELFRLQGDGPLPRTSIFDYGGFVQAGYFVVPQKCEVYARTSQITGPFGTGSEYAGGFNWFFLPGKQNLRYTLDAAWINHSPADQNRTDYRAGDTGLLLRSQVQFYF